MHLKSIESLRAHNIICDSLPDSDKERIEEIGFERWLDEAADRQLAARKSSQVPKVTVPEADRQRVAVVERVTKSRSLCSVCSTVFYSRRADAVYCSKSCRDKGSRRGLKHRRPSDGLNAAIKPFCEA